MEAFLCDPRTKAAAEHPGSGEGPHTLPLILSDQEAPSTEGHTQGPIDFSLVIESPSHAGLSAESLTCDSGAGQDGRVHLLCPESRRAASEAPMASPSIAEGQSTRVLPRCLRAGLPARGWQTAGSLHPGRTRGNADLAANTETPETSTPEKCGPQMSRALNKDRALSKPWLL